MEITVTQSNNWRSWINRMLSVRDKTEEVCKRLCEVGERVISQTHHKAGTRVWYEKTEDGYKVCAEGEDILFIEFGTGDRAGELIPWYDEVPASIRPGSWSEGHAQQYSTQGYWYFGGRYYRYTEPHPAFFEAYKAMVEALPKIAQEVFSK